MSELESLGRERHAIHKEHTTPRFFDDPNEEDIIGVYGENCFAQDFHLPMDKTLKINGDAGVDFVTSSGTINVKTARKPIFLFVKENEPKADIYVLARFSDDKAVSLLGWEFGKEMITCPKKDFGYGITNFYKAATELRNMDSLHALLDNVPEMLTMDELRARGRVTEYKTPGNVLYFGLGKPCPACKKVWFSCSSDLKGHRNSGSCKGSGLGSLDWRSSNFGDDSEICASSKDPTLVQAILQQGMVHLGNYDYSLSANQKWLKRKRSPF